jgi:hypothetical protein
MMSTFRVHVFIQWSINWTWWYLDDEDEDNNNNNNDDGIDNDDNDDTMNTPLGYSLALSPNSDDDNDNNKIN